jgi:hypothetical protein
MKFLLFGNNSNITTNTTSDYSEILNPLNLVMFTVTGFSCVLLCIGCIYYQYNRNRRDTLHDRYDDLSLDSGTEFVSLEATKMRKR